MNQIAQIRETLQALLGPAGQAIGVFQTRASALPPADRLQARTNSTPSICTTRVKG